MTKTENSLFSVLNIQRIVLTVLGYRLHISIIFGILLFQNNLYLNSAVDYTLLTSLFLWHLALYLFDRVYDSDLDRESQPEEYIRHSHKNFVSGIIAIALGVSLVLYLLGRYNLKYWLILLPITFLYTLPIYKGIRVKNILFLKNIFSAVFIWALPLYFQALNLSPTTQIPDKTIFSIMMLAISVIIGEIFWDIRDTSVDKKNNIHTVPNTFGLLYTKLFLFALLVVEVYLTGRFEWSGSVGLYCVLIPFVNEGSNRILFHVPPLIALAQFCL